MGENDDTRFLDLGYEHHEADSRYHISCHEEAGQLVIVIVGEVLTPAPERFAQRMARTLTRSTGRGLLLDLSACAYLSSGAISHLIRYIQAAAKQGGSSVMLVGNPRVQAVLELLGLDGICPIVADRQDALRLLGAA